MNYPHRFWIVGGVIIVVAVAVIVWFNKSKPFYPDINSPRPVKGSSEADITLQEFSDFQCPACLAAQPVVQDVIKTFSDRLKLEYKHYPLVTIHTQAFRAALAAECANDQGKFWEYHDLLFANQPSFSTDELLGYASQLDLKADSFAACLDSRAKTSVVRADVAEGGKRGVNATPTFFLNGEKVQDWTKLKELIQSKLVGG
ncbi:MAG: thioredoxin domain-containing protein [Candidatus Kerfeldbacteria bacterium]|nr:thioredoxin domain-containing protein [Candidatus Kerfeldbacteria bacterium]